MVGFDFLLWAFICHVCAFITVETGSFGLPAIHFSLAGLLVLGIGFLLCWGFSFVFGFDCGGFSIGRGILWFVWFVAGA